MAKRIVHIYKRTHRLTICGITSFEKLVVVPDVFSKLKDKKNYRLCKKCEHIHKKQRGE